MQQQQKMYLQVGRGCSVDDVKGAEDLVGHALVIQELSCKETEAGNHGDSTGVKLKGVGQLLPFPFLGLVVVRKVNPRQRRCIVLIG